MSGMWDTGKLFGKHYTLPSTNYHLFYFFSPRTAIAASKTPSSSEDSPYLVMSPGEPDKHKFEMRTSSIDSNGGARPKTTSQSGLSSRNSSRNYLRGQSDSQRSSLCFEDPMDFGISPQDNSGSTLIGKHLKK